MPIWRHADSAELDAFPDPRGESSCRFCGTSMIDMSSPDDPWEHESLSYGSLYREWLFAEHDGHSCIESLGIEDHPGSWQIDGGPPSEVYLNVGVCPACGWWSAEKQVALYAPKQIWDMHLQTQGALRTLDLANIALPISDVRAYLLANYTSRFNVHPKRLEDVVGSVFHDYGYDAVVTAYSADGGIDVILQGGKGERIGVQVKRYKDRIKVEQIRSFVGALMLGQYAQGIFVTTSGYQSGAQEVVRQSGSTCVPIELLDAKAFFEALSIAQISTSTAMSYVAEMLASEQPPKLHLVNIFHRGSL